MSDFYRFFKENMEGLGLVMHMKDALLLLATAAACSSGAWVFWHYLGNDAFGTMTTLALVGVVADNFRLRRRLRVKPR